MKEMFISQRNRDYLLKIIIFILILNILFWFSLLKKYLTEKITISDP